MRRIASVASFIALIWLALLSFSTTEARAYWGGASVDPACPGGGGLAGSCPSAYEGCFSWALFYNPGSPAVLSMTPFYNPWDEGTLAGFDCIVRYVPIENAFAVTVPGCYLPGEVNDATEPGGCRPVNAAPLAKELGCPDCNGGRPGIGNPISLGGGNKYQAVTDFETATPDKLGFTRYYNSGGALDRQRSILGAGWRSVFDAYIDTTHPGWYVYVHRPDGQVLEMDFAFGSSTWYAIQADVDLQLTQTGSSWVLTDSDDTVWTFTQLTAQAPAAVLASIKRRSGYTQTLQYDASGQLASVTDSYGRTLQFTFQNGLLSTITAPDGGVYQYLYQNVYQTLPIANLQQLVRVVKPGQSPASPPQNYLYENAIFPAALTGIVDDNGNRYATYSYEQWGRPTTTQHGSADLYTVTYNDSDRSRTVTNPLGLVETYQFAGLLGSYKVTRIDRAASGSTPASFSTYSYDANAYPSSTTDWNGVVTNRTNDTRGQPLSIVTAAGTPQARTVTYTWDATYHVPTQIVEPGRTTTFTYANGLLTAKTQTDTTGTGRSRSWAYTYTPTGLVQTAKGPRTDVDDTVTYGYDASGTLVSVTNPLGQRTQITAHDGAGRPLTAVDANGVATNMTYTPQGWLNTATVVAAGGNAVTTIDHDAEGQITRITSPDGSSLAYTYDAAHRLVRLSDAFDERIDYTLDAMGGRTLEQIHTSGGAALAKTQSRVFDALDRLLQSIGAANQTTSYAYDNVGNLASTTDPLSHVTGQSFDTLNRLIQVAAPLSSTSVYGYDSHDNRTSVTDPRGLVTSYVYDGLDNLIQVTSPDTGTTVYAVDAAGNRTQSADAAGHVAQMSYDALNRITAKSFPADPTENMTFTYDGAGAGFGIGRLTTVTDEAGSTSFVYDARGNVVQETHVIDGMTYTTAYAYDLADHVVQITYPSGRIVTFTRDAMGRIAGIATQANSAAVPVAVASGAAYAPFGPLTALAYGNGLSLSAQYDQDYQPSARLVTGTAVVQDLTYGIDAAGDITGITDLAATTRSQVFQYDSLYRLTYASGLYGALAYGYDAVGNRTSQSGGTNNLAETYSYAAGGNQLLSVANAGTVRTLVYSATGDVASEDFGNGTVLSYGYDEGDRLVQVASPTQVLAVYDHNYLGQRVVKDVSGTPKHLHKHVQKKLPPPIITEFVYDGAGHLLAEADGGTGATLKEYLWLDDMPVGMTSAGTLYFVHPDHLGTPQKITDATQALAYDAVLRPFGEVQQLTAPALTNLRFPGQYYDSESGLAQNW